MRLFREALSKVGMVAAVAVLDEVLEPSLQPSQASAPGQETVPGARRLGVKRSAVEGSGAPGTSRLLGSGWFFPPQLPRAHWTGARSGGGREVPRMSSSPGPLLVRAVVVCRRGSRPKGAKVMLGGARKPVSFSQCPAQANEFWGFIVNMGACFSTESLPYSRGSQHRAELTEDVGLCPPHTPSLTHSHAPTRARILPLFPLLISGSVSFVFVPC